MKTKRYTVKCDDCKAVLKETDSLRESAEGGFCPTCTALHRQQSARAMAATQAAPEEVTGC